ncbi:MAG: amidohydrolase family protein [Gemmatimonadota bacterium]|nr:amidohydrolase family protein [Gemmatimonadota bacterium]
MLRSDLAGGLRLAVPLLALAALPLAAQEGDDEADLPLEPDRTLALDMTSGSWISLDVSPDGRTIAFDYLGDLFTMPIEGGDATQLTSGMAFDAQPRFSPDGSRIVFTSDRDGGQNIWVMSLDGSDTTRISRGSANRAESPEWTPDGDYIVASIGDFRGSDLPRLRLFHVDGGTGAQLIDEPESLKTIGAAVSPDGRYIWYSRRNGDWTYNAQFPQYQLEAYDRDTGERYTRSSRYGSAIRPTLSPDGRWLVFGTRHDDQTGLIVRDLGSGAERWLAYPVQHDDQESRATLDVLPGMSFTPDSRFLVASYGGKIWKLPIVGGPAEEIPFRVRFDLDLAPRVDFDYPIEDTPTFTARQIRDAVPSPDGTRLAFTALDRLWVSGSDGSNPRRLTDADMSEHYPTWSPDGQSIAYATWDGEAGHLYRVAAAGGTPVRLTSDAATYFTPAWAPNGRIVAMRGFASTFESQGASGPPANEIVWVPANPTGQNGSAATLIAPTDGRSGPHFVEASDRIWLHRSPDALVSIRWDGTDEKEHVRVRGPTPTGSSQGLSPSSLKMAPRGDQALAEVQRHLYTVTVPQIGTAPTINVSNPDNASFPARRLTDIGGEFASWGADGRTVHWSLGNAHFVYDLDAAQAFEDSVAAARAEEAEGEEEAGGEPVEEDEGEEEEDDDDGYRPAEYRITIEAPRDIPEGSAILRGARVITMVGDEVIENADIVIADNRIAAVGPSGQVDAPGDATVIDVSGTTIVPGFVDAHAHLRARDGIHRTDVWPYLANLAYGVTTTRDPQTGNTEVLSYSDMVRTGAVLGPRIYSTGPGVFWQDGVSSLDDARDLLSRYSDYFDTKTIKMYVAGARQARQYIIMAARELELMPTTEGSLNIKQNLTETIDGYPGLEHSIPIFPVYDDYVQLFVETGRVYTPTLLVSYGGPWAENWFYSRENPHDDAKLRRFVPHDQVDSRTLRRGQWFRNDQHVFARHAEFVKALVEAGGKAGVGSHGQLQGLGYHWELWAMQSGGLDEHDALRVATIFGAEAIGLDQDIGTIEAGKLADLVVLEGNPLDDIRNTNSIRQVMMNGRLYDGDTLDEVYPRQRAFGPLWWWDDEPEGVPGVATP